MNTLIHHLFYRIPKLTIVFDKYKLTVLTDAIYWKHNEYNATKRIRLYSVSCDHNHIKQSELNTIL